MQSNASNLLNILLPELEIWSDISQSNSQQKCIQIADILSLLMLHKYLLLKGKKKSLKKRGNFPSIACTFANRKKREHARSTLTTDNWFTV
jgi:hypothetical protein